MPTYVYKNQTTGEIFELEQRITEAALTHHPETGDPVSRVIQAAGIVFKGSGFYKTDSRSSSTSKNAPEKTDKPSTSSESAASETSKIEPKQADSKQTDSKQTESKPSSSSTTKT